jgi:hypothetical protein
MDTLAPFAMYMHHTADACEHDPCDVAERAVPTFQPFPAVGKLYEG